MVTFSESLQACCNRVGSLQTATAAVFMPQKLATTTNLPRRELVGKTFSSTALAN